MAFESSSTALGIQSLDLSQSINATAPYSINGLRFGANDNFFNQTVDAYDPYLGYGRFIYGQAPSSNTAGATISSITSTGTVATVTTSSAHNLTPGTKVILAGQVPTAYVGTFVVVSTPSTTTYTINLSTSTTTAATTVGTYTYGTIRPGVVVSLSPTIANGVVTTNFALWDGTANTGRTLAVAYTSLLANEYGFAQISGVAVVSATAIGSVGAPIYYGGTAGLVSTGSTISKQVLNAQSAGSIGSVIGTGNDAITLASATTTSSQGLIFINNPFAQGAIT